MSSQADLKKGSWRKWSLNVMGTLVSGIVFCILLVLLLLINVCPTDPVSPHSGLYIVEKCSGLIVKVLRLSQWAHLLEWVVSSSWNDLDWVRRLYDAEQDPHDTSALPTHAKPFIVDSFYLDLNGWYQWATGTNMSRVTQSSDLGTWRHTHHLCTRKAEAWAEIQLRFRLQTYMSSIEIQTTDNLRVL